MSFEQIKLGNVIRHRKGFITIDDNKEYKLCRVQLHRRGVVLREVVKGSAIRTKKQQVCKAGDFLVAEMDAKVGGYGFVPNELDGAIVSSHYFLFELDERKIRPKYLEVISQLQILQNQIKAVGSTNYAAIRPANVLNWDIPITNINKQKKIEELFDSTRAIGNELGTEFSNQQDLLTQLRQSFLREGMTGKLVKQDPKDGHAKDLLEKIKAEKAKSGKKEKELPPIKPEDIPFEIPENWVWCRLGDICESSFYGPRFGKSEYVVNGIPTIRTTDMTDNGNIILKNTPCVFINDRKKIDLYKVNDGDLLLTRSGSIGIMAVFRGDYLAFPSAYLIRFRFMKAIAPEFIYFLLKSPFWQTLLGLNSRATAQVNINAVNILKLPIPLPPFAQQNRIVIRLEGLMNNCDELQKSIQESQEQNELLLQQVLKEALMN